MPKTPANHNASWTPRQVQELRREAKQNTPTQVLALHLGRTPAAVQQKASALGISLKLTNQRPYGTKKK